MKLNGVMLWDPSYCRLMIQRMVDRLEGIHVKSFHLENEFSEHTILRFSPSVK